jgi:hypothetical protein
MSDSSPVVMIQTKIFQNRSPILEILFKQYHGINLDEGEASTCTPMN